MTDYDLAAELRKNSNAARWLREQALHADSIREGLIREAEARGWTADRIRAEAS